MPGFLGYLRHNGPVNFWVTSKGFLSRCCSFAILHYPGNKDCFIDKYTRLHSGNAKTYRSLESHRSNAKASLNSNISKTNLRVKLIFDL